MLTTFQAILIGLSQGLTELFPISSLGHSVILPRLLGWKVGSSDQFLAFLVLTHLATALVLLGFFWRDWVRIARGVYRSVRVWRVVDDDAKLGWLLVVATIPAGVLGLLLQKRLQELFTSAALAAVFLAVNGLVLLAAERTRRRAVVRPGLDGDRAIARTVSYRQAAAIGAFQVLALLPGFSRSGAAMSGGLRVGLGEVNAARFAFLMATPIIGAAAVLKLPHALAAGPALGAMVMGALAAALAAYLSVRFLVRYFETRSLRPFGYYCLVGGIGYALILQLR